MKFKKVIFTSIAAVSLSAVVSPAISSPQNTVNAAIKTKSLTKNAFVYNAKGKKVKSAKLAKGKKVKILGTKIIKGKKYYRIGKNKYVRVANFKAISKPTNPKVDTVPVPNTNNSISPTPTEPSVPNVPQQQPTNNNSTNSNTSNSNSNTDKPAEPTKPTSTPATQADKDLLIAYLKQVNSITNNNDSNYEKYYMSSFADKNSFKTSILQANDLLSDTTATVEDLNKAKDAVEKAYNKLDGKYYVLPCSSSEYYYGKYKLTDADKTAILALVNKVEGSTDAHFISSDNDKINYTHDNIYILTTSPITYVKFAKQ